MNAEATITVAPGSDVTDAQIRDAVDRAGLTAGVIERGEKKGG